jgi:GYF domain 2
MASQDWYLLKAQDREVYGPIKLDQLQVWAAEAKIAPLDKVSSDGRESWVRAPMVPELQMDWLIEMPDNYLYGPTSVGTIQEFLATGEIDGDVTVINCLEGTSSRLAEQPFFSSSPHHVRSAETMHLGTAYHDSSEGGESSGQRLRAQRLERQVMELQRDLGIAEAYIASLRQQFIEATGREPL